MPQKSHAARLSDRIDRAAAQVNSLQKVDHVIFRYPTKVVPVHDGIMVKELRTGALLESLSGIRLDKAVKVPQIYRDADTQELVIGSYRFPIHGGPIDSYSLA